jgi:hypothetical protein
MFRSSVGGGEVDCQASYQGSSAALGTVKESLGIIKGRVT